MKIVSANALLSLGALAAAADATDVIKTKIGGSDVGVKNKNRIDPNKAARALIQSLTQGRGRPRSLEGDMSMPSDEGAPAPPFADLPQTVAAFNANGLDISVDEAAELIKKEDASARLRGGSDEGGHEGYASLCWSRGDYDNYFGGGDDDDDDDNYFTPFFCQEACSRTLSLLFAIEINFGLESCSLITNPKFFAIAIANNLFPTEKIDIPVVLYDLWGQFLIEIGNDVSDIGVSINSPIGERIEDIGEGIEGFGEYKQEVVGNYEDEGDVRL